MPAKRTAKRTTKRTAKKTESLEKSINRVMKEFKEPRPPKKLPVQDKRKRTIYDERPLLDVRGQRLIRTRNLVDKWQNDTSAFVRESIGLASGKDGYVIDPKQDEIMQEFDKLVLAKEKKARGERMTQLEVEYASKMGLTVRSGKGGGKTSVVSWIATKFLTMFRGSKIIATAPKQDLLRDQLWGELSKWKRYSSRVHGEESFLFKCFEIQADKAYIKSDPKEWFMVARTCSRNAQIEDQKATLQGYHATYQLIIVDEAYGVPDAVFEPLTTTLTQAVNIVIVIGNPTKNYGYAHDTWEKPELAKYFIPIQINCEQSTLVTTEHLARLRDLYKNAPNLYRVNVLGLPPVASDDKLIPYSAIMEAVDREFPPGMWIDEPTFAAVDIGAGGDLSASCIVQGPKVHPIRTFSSNKPEVVAREIVTDCFKWGVLKCGLDGIGVGWGVTPLLTQEGISAIPIDVRNEAYDKTKFYNLRSGLYWKLRTDFIEGNISIENDEELIRELAVIELEKPDDATRVQVMSKQKMRKLGMLKTSPNRADSLMLSRYFTFQMRKAIKEYQSDDIDERYKPLEESESFMSV